MGQVDGQTAFGWFPSMCVILIDEKERMLLLESIPGIPDIPY